MKYPTAMMMLATALFQEVESPAGYSGVLNPGSRSGRMKPEGVAPAKAEEDAMFEYTAAESINEVLLRLQKKAEKSMDENAREDLYMSLRSRAGGV